MVAVIVCAFTTKLALELGTELLPQLPVPPVDAAVTVNAVVPPGVEALVVIVRVDVVLEFETVVGLNEAFAPVGSVPLNTRGMEVQVPLPVHVVVIRYVEEFGGVTGLGVCAPAVTAVIVRGACTTREVLLL